MTRPETDSSDLLPNSPRLLADYAIASTFISSPARSHLQRRSPSSPHLTGSMVTMVEKALLVLGQCASPELHRRKRSVLPLIKLPKHLAERALSWLSSEDLSACAATCQFLHSCIPASAAMAAQRLGCESCLLGASGEKVNKSITSQLHKFECQAWIAARTLEKLTMFCSRSEREAALLRIASLPLPAVAQHDVKLLKLTTCGHREVRLRALRTLSQFSVPHIERLLDKDLSAVDAVISCLSDSDEHVRRAAITVLHAWLEPNVMLPHRVSWALLGCCSDANEQVRWAADRLLQAQRDSTMYARDIEGHTCMLQHGEC